jgi:hypothetical protein
MLFDSGKTNKEVKLAISNGTQTKQISVYMNVTGTSSSTCETQNDCDGSTLSNLKQKCDGNVATCNYDQIVLYVPFPEVPDPVVEKEPVVTQDSMLRFNFYLGFAT